MYRVCSGIGLVLFLAILLNILVPQPVVGVFCGLNKSHNLLIGQRLPGDTLLHMDHPKLGYNWFMAQTVYINFPGKNDTPGNVTFIEIYDQYRDGHGGCAWLEGGGVGKPFVNIKLKSNIGYGIDFIVRIFGKAIGITNE